MENETFDPLDKSVQKRALKAFKKRIKITRLDDETGGSRGAFSGGKVSGVYEIIPPKTFPQPVWDELVKIGRLKESNGFYELVN
jgi:hypothetical protein